jgi:hypothetical protein
MLEFENMTVDPNNHCIMRFVVINYKGTLPKAQHDCHNNSRKMATGLNFSITCFDILKLLHITAFISVGTEECRNGYCLIVEVGFNGELGFISQIPSAGSKS